MLEGDLRYSEDSTSKPEAHLPGPTGGTEVVSTRHTCGAFLTLGHFMPASSGKIISTGVEEIPILVFKNSLQKTEPIKLPSHLNSFLD